MCVRARVRVTYAAVICQTTLRRRAWARVHQRAGARAGTGHANRAPPHRKGPGGKGARAGGGSRYACRPSGGRLAGPAGRPAWAASPNRWVARASGPPGRPLAGSARPLRRLGRPSDAGVPARPWARPGRMSTAQC